MNLRTIANVWLLVVTIMFGAISCNDIDLPVDGIANNELTVTETPAGGAVLNYKWGVDQITWSYEPSDDYPEFMSEIIYALDIWQDHTTDFSFYYAGENNSTANLYFVDVISEPGIFQAKLREMCSFLDQGSKMRAFSCLTEDMPGRDLLSEDQILDVYSHQTTHEVSFEQSCRELGFWNSELEQKLEAVIVGNIPSLFRIMIGIIWV